jgi:hypothetical protein
VDERALEPELEQLCVLGEFLEVLEDLRDTVNTLGGNTVCELFVYNIQGLQLFLREALNKLDTPYKNKKH